MKSNTVNEKMIFESNPLTEALHRYRRKKICLKFPILKGSNYDSYLSLWKYLSNIPERFYLKKASKDMFRFLNDLKENDVSSIADILNKYYTPLSSAFKTLYEINLLEFHDAELPTDEYNLMQFCDRNIHFNYLRLVEGVFGNLIYPISEYQRFKRNVKIESFDLYNRVYELKSTQYQYLSDFYSNTIRNAIAHGKIIYKAFEIVYIDKTASKNLLYNEIIEYFDKMLDICNGLALGFRLFIISNLDFIEKYRIAIPHQIMIEELQAETDAPGFEIIGCLESETIDKKNQLNIYVKNKLFDPPILQYYVFYSAVLAERFAPGYDRYFIILDKNYFKFGLAAFNGSKLKELREQRNKNLENYVNALEKDLFLIKPKIKLPRLFYRIITLLSSFKIMMSLKLEELKVTPKLVVDPRYTEIHRNGHHSVVKGK